MATPYAQLSPQQQAQWQAIDLKQTQAVSAALQALQHSTELAAMWGAFGPTLALMDPTEQVQRANLPSSAFAAATRCGNDLINCASSIQATAEVAMGGANPAIFAQVIGVEHLA